MGWVTLALRKRELKAEHQYYQLRDLQIAREKRQLARKKSYEMAKIQAAETEALAPLKQAYQTERNELMKNIGSLYGTSQKDPGTDNVTVNENSDEVNTDPIKKTGVQSKIGDIDQGKLYQYQQSLANAQTNYQEEVNAQKDYYDQEKQMLEEEVGEEETQLEMEQVDVETQMEAISAELEAVSQAISSEIKSSAIKLA